MKEKGQRQGDSHFIYFELPNLGGCKHDMSYKA